MKITRKKLREAIKERFGSFGESCLDLSELRSSREKISDLEIEVAFNALAGRHRKCFNKKAFIASCRDPD